MQQSFWLKYFRNGLPKSAAKSSFSAATQQKIGSKCSHKFAQTTTKMVFENAAAQEHLGFETIPNSCKEKRSEELVPRNSFNKVIANGMKVL